MTSTRRSRLRGRLSGDGGFALVEVMVSAVLLVVLATATLNIIDKSGTASATTRLRSAATGLAQEDQDGMRVMSVTKLDRRDYTYTKTVGGIDYTVRSVAEWVRDGGTATCDSNTARVEYLKTTSYVTWPGHTNDPVTLESYISPGVESISKGSLMVKLHTVSGTGVPNVRVDLSTGQSGTTDLNGCVMFTGLDAGSLVATWNGTAGDYVDRNGVQGPAENITIGAGQTAQIDRLWDKAGNAVVRWIDENRQAVIPTTTTAPNGGIGATVINSLITNPSTQTRLFDNRTSSVASSVPQDPAIAPITTLGQTTKITELFPFTPAASAINPYSVYAGGCAANNPVNYQSTFVMPTVPIQAGLDSAQTDVPIATASVLLTGAPRNGTVTKVKLINQSSDTNCLDTVALDAASPSTTVFRVPYSNYNVCVQKSYNSTNYYYTPGNNTTPAFTVNAVPPSATSKTVTLTNAALDDTKWVRGTC